MGQPHKCPVCDGEGKKANMRTHQIEDCPSCQGSGVVWEPEGQQEGARRPMADDDVLDLTGS